MTGYQHPMSPGTSTETDRDRMPYIQIDTDLWVVMREHKEHPKAVIRCVIGRNQVAKYLLMTWHEEPSKRRLVSMHDTLDAANQAVLWSLAPVRAAQATRQGPGFDGYPPPMQKTPPADSPS